MERIYDVIIIGGGPGGYTAALYCARAGLDTVILEKLSAGGQMALTTQIDNYPGFDEGIDGFELGEKMQLGAERFGATSEMAEVESVSLHSNPKEVRTSEGTFYGKCIIIATGANPRMLGAEHEEELVGNGVNYCAACDGMFYKDKKVFVIGGGNSAAGDALLLSKICKEVILVHRRDTLRAEKIYHKSLMQATNVQFRWNSAVKELIYDEKLRGILLENKQTGEEWKEECDGIFVSIGRSPATELFKEQLTLDRGGYIVADESTKTNIPGVFAVGDVRTKVMRQVITAAADGAVASHYVEEYLAELEG
ncbi:MAG: thioredoxin-disulfide reductase [Eubacteriales bacterium]|nr:thioredoxin-disulfide reductase [Eubacteriales bacterium]